ncbi:N-acyl-phosphatidylethanolamine-hydrolyzing phospholipase D [Cytospora mali]|uniref:N-acyl-phosphatidylethanolamine-hydrolyzing phospholipase D n=1 Tax=Cytospora mali TaxID=578113 RepID=A0A194VF14_CYTMA|nr:N-acyl-phosphatidylethanolamine-hydrolyzing phospholipase D [Valsa mali var. pyri (nom. inval.)]
MALRFIRQLSAITFHPPISVSANNVMNSYSSTVVSKEPSAAPDDAKAHHIKDHSGTTIRFQNPFPSFGRWGDVSFIRGAGICLRFLPSRGSGSSLRTTWIGHATCYVEFPSGFRALFDPVVEEKFSSLSPKRFTPVACNAGDFPALDVVFISHNHHDHLSLTSVQQLARLYPGVHFFVGLGMAKWFQDSGISKVTEMDWWDDADIALERTIAPGDVKSEAAATIPERISARISCLSSQHGLTRNGLDYARTLWASWAVSSGGKSVWFAGDTGYRAVPEGVEELGPGFDDLPRNPQFSQIGDLRDTKCKAALGIHWGTWALTSEPIDEPPEKLRKALELKGLSQTGLFDVCAIGESRDF